MHIEETNLLLQSILEGQRTSNEKIDRLITSCHTRTAKNQAVVTEISEKLDKHINYHEKKNGNGRSSKRIGFIGLLKLLLVALLPR